MKKAIILLIGMIFIVGCTSCPMNKENIAPTSQEITTRCCKLDWFQSIVVNGNAKVKLVNGQYAIRVTGVQSDQYDYQNNIKNQVLYVGGDEQTANAVITITAPKLKNITAADNASVYAKNFKSCNLSITAKGNASIDLDGRFNIKKISQLGTGRINIDWVDSNYLYIDSEASGPIYLAGRTCYMEAKLIKDANLHAHYLRARNGSVFTTDNATAEILVLDTLKAFAVNNSNIHYYQRPKKLTMVTRDTANILYYGPYECH